MLAPLDTPVASRMFRPSAATNSFLRRARTIFNIVAVSDDDDGTGGTIDEPLTTAIVELIG